MAKRPQQEEFDDTHNGWAEHRVRFPRDMELRAGGFKIERRPKNGEVIWSRNGEYFTVEEAESALEMGRGR